MTDTPWVELITYASGFEADITVARLEAEDIPAMRDNNDTVVIFGPGFQGASAFGITVRVPLDRLDDARAVLADVAPEGAWDETDDSP